ncbi:hypothetical protein ADJ73_06700 [Arsenicicoccus sp. oral taxon 190]|nr:hypothetical protein ADJ73_06700 [Arsenicicoccus sp. oral taxon 190]
MGALGGGGAILLVPVLVYLLHLPPLAATTTSLVVVGVSSLVSAWSAGRRGLVDGRMAGAFVIAGVLGSAVGTRASHLVPQDVLMGMFGVLLLVVAGLMLRRARSPQEPDAGSPQEPGAGSPQEPDAGPPQEPGADPREVVTGLRARGPRWGRLVAAATGVGLLTGFFGVGGGFAIVPALTLLLDVPISLAVGTSLLVIAGNSVTSLVWRLDTLGRLDAPLTTALTVAMVVGGLLGGRVGRRTSAARLQRAFGALLVVVAGFTLLESWR